MIKVYIQDTFFNQVMMLNLHWNIIIQLRDVRKKPFVPPRIHIVTFGKKWPYTNNTQGSIKKVTIQVSLKGLYSDIEPAVLSLYGCFLVSQCDHILTIHWQYMAIKKKVTIQIRIRAPYIDNCSAVLSPYGCFFVIHPDNIPTIHRQYIACSQKEQWTLVQGCPIPYTPSFISL